MGITGAAVALGITNTLNLVSVSIAVGYVKDLEETWFLPDATTMKGLPQFLKICIPSIGMMCLEWWTVEALALFAGLISVEAASAVVIVENTALTLFMIPQGF